MKKVFSEISQNSQENSCAKVSFLINFRKESLTGVFFVNFVRNFEHLFSFRTYISRTTLVAASD